jgi:hypothetical protein
MSGSSPPRRARRPLGRSLILAALTVPALLAPFLMAAAAEPSAAAASSASGVPSPSPSPTTVPPPPPHCSVRFTRYDEFAPSGSDDPPVLGQIQVVDDGGFHVQAP